MPNLDNEKLPQAVMLLLLCAIMIAIGVSGCCTFWRDTTFHLKQMKDGRTIRVITAANEIYWPKGEKGIWACTNY